MYGGPTTGDPSSVRGILMCPTGAVNTTVPWAPTLGSKRLFVFMSKVVNRIIDKTYAGKHLGVGERFDDGPCQAVV
jgi:hypothetical protein